MIKLFASDLDGTFLNGLHVSSRLSKKAVQTVMQANLEFAIVTGRHLHNNHRIGIKYLMNMPIYKIGMNGAIIWDKQHQVIYQKAIAESFLLEMTERFPQVSFEWITRKGVFVKLKRLSHFKVTLRRGMSIKILIKYLLATWAKDYHFNVEMIPDEVLMVSCRVGDEQTGKQLQQFLKEHHHIVTNYGPNIKNFEIVAASVNKQVAVSWLADHLHLSEDDVAVYGNDLNDVPMLSYFSQSYATQNAVDAAKHAAKHIIGSNYDDAVAKHILQTIDGEKHL